MPILVALLDAFLFMSSFGIYMDFDFFLIALCGHFDLNFFILDHIFLRCGMSYIGDMLIHRFLWFFDFVNFIFDI